MIGFNSRSERYSEFSNFYRSPFLLDGKTWRTVEHYYQANKFLPDDPEWAEKIRMASGPGTAKKLGRSDEHQMRDDWDDVKDDVMERALRAKFDQNPGCMLLLLGTKEELLVEHTPWGDFYWGDGGDGTGLNQLGVLLMDLRASCRQQEQREG